MTREQSTAPDLLDSSVGRVLIVAAIAVLFLVPRIVLVFARDPFFDELFTIWITRRPFGGILDALRLDSGPPLFYFLVRILGIETITGARLFSLVCETGALAAILASRTLGKTRFTVALLLAVYPPAVVMAADARAYALALLFVTIALLALERGRPLSAALAFAAAAWSHYYGVLFFPVLLFGAAPFRRRLAAFAIASLLFLPQLVVAVDQPREAMSWMNVEQAAVSRWAPLYNLSFAGEYPYVLLHPVPTGLIAAAIVLLAIAVLQDRRNAPAVIIPVVLAVMAGFAGRQVYFPLRFEAVMAVPLALWAAVSLSRWSPRLRLMFTTGLVAIGILVVYVGTMDHLHRPLDPFHAATYEAHAIAAPQEPIVASGYAYLGLILGAGEERVRAFPAEQADHPGWRARKTRQELEAEVRTLPREFLYVGERGSLEAAVVGRARKTQPIFANKAIVIARVR